MNARDELAADIVSAIEDLGGFIAWTDDAPEGLAEKLVAAGWRTPARTITTAEELDALQMVVVRTTAGTIANIVNGRAYCFGYEASAPVGALALPVTVLWEPQP